MIDRTVILCLLVTIVTSQNVDVIGNCSDGTINSLDIWGVQRDPLTCSMRKPKNCNSTSWLESRQLSDVVPGSPQSVIVEGHLIPNDHGELAPQLVVTWQTPGSENGIENLKGFYMEIRNLSGKGTFPSFLCRVYDFSQNNFTTQDSNLTFQKKEVGYLGGNDHLYRLDLYSLPRSHQSVPLKKYFKFPKLQRVISNRIKSTRSWTAAVSYSVEDLTAVANITILFSLAPESCGFDQYLVQLVDVPPAKNAVKSCDVTPWKDYECQDRVTPGHNKSVKSISHTFFNVPSGTYAVWIQPRDFFKHNNSACLCYSLIIGTERICLPCATTHTGEITVEAEKIVTSQSTPFTNIRTSTDGQVTGDNPVGLIVAVVLGIAGLGIFTVIGYFCWKRWKRRYDEDIYPEDEPPKKIYLLYTNDHKEHEKVVSKFASYLTHRCNCQVFFLPWFRGQIQSSGSYEWIISHIDKADYTIIVNSEAAYNIFHARNSNTSFIFEEEGPEGDTFGPAITHLQTKSQESDFFKKTILVYFGYTDETFALTEFSPGVVYQVPKHILNLLSHIHEVNMSRIMSRKSLYDLEASSEGRDLLEAINKAKHFQKRERNWFSTSYRRIDSGYDSEHYRDQLGQSVSVNDLPNYDKYNYEKSAVTINTNWDDEKSAFTVDTDYLNTHPGHGYKPIPPSEVNTVSTTFINQRFMEINRQSQGNHVQGTQFSETPFPGKAYQLDCQPGEGVSFPLSELDQNNENVALLDRRYSDPNQASRDSADIEQEQDKSSRQNDHGNSTSENDASVYNHVKCTEHGDQIQNRSDSEHVLENGHMNCKRVNGGHELGTVDTDRFQRSMDSGYVNDGSDDSHVRFLKS